MKPKRIFKLILILTAIVNLTSCCYSDATNNGAINIEMYNSPYSITKVKFVGTNREKYIGDYIAQVSLNPADTQCTFRVYYNNDSDDVTLGYKGFPSNMEDNCKEKLDIHYQVKIVSTTFSYAYVPSGFLNSDKNVQVTP